MHRCLGSSKGFQLSRSVIGLSSLHSKTNMAGDYGLLSERRCPSRLHGETKHELWVGTYPRGFGPHVSPSLAGTDGPSSVIYLFIPHSLNHKTKTHSLGTF